MSMEGEVETKDVNVMQNSIAPKDTEVDETKIETPTGGEI